MKRMKLVAAGAAAVFALAIGTTTVVSADLANPQGESKKQQATTGEVSTATSNTCRRMSAANSAGQDIFLSTSEPVTYTSTDWQDVNCTGTTFKLKPGQRALVTADFNAEVDCYGDESSAQWCLTRALLDGVEGAPIAPEPSSFAFDNVATGVNDWQANSMNRGWEIKCKNTAKQGDCRYKFVVQTRMHDASVAGMWLDDIGLRLTVTPGQAAAL